VPLSLAGEVVARWLSHPDHQDRRRRPRALARAEFDALVASVSSDVRGRALLDELLRLRAEAAALLGVAELPADVFARPGVP